MPASSLSDFGVFAWDCVSAMVEAETDAKVADGMANGTFEDVNFRRVKEMDEDGKENEQNKAVRMDEDHELKEEKESKQEEEREVENTEAVKMEEEKGSKKRGKGRNAGGKEVVKKKLVDEKSAEESSALVASSSDRPVRKRKSVKRQVVSIEKEVMEEFHIEKGIGTPLKEIPNVADKLSRKKTDDIFKMLFMILFGRRGKAFDIKKNMSQFSGFVCHENEEKQRLKIKEKFDKCIKEKLLEFCDVLDIPVAKATRKEDIVMKLIDFLAAPHAMTDVLLAEKEESSKARKRKRVVKRSAKSRGVSAKCLARFKMQEYSQSSSIQTESETMRKLRVEVHNLTQQVNELRAMVDEMWLKVSRYNNSNGIGGDNLNNARCKLLHWMGTGEVVAEGQITSTNPQSLLYHHVPIGPLCWKVLVNHVIVHNVHLYRPMPEMFTLKDAIRSTIAWPNEFIILDA